MPTFSYHFFVVTCDDDDNDDTKMCFRFYTAKNSRFIIVKGQ